MLVSLSRSLVDLVVRIQASRGRQRSPAPGPGNAPGAAASADGASAAEGRDFEVPPLGSLQPRLARAASRGVGARYRPPPAFRG